MELILSRKSNKTLTNEQKDLRLIPTKKGFVFDETYLNLLKKRFMSLRGVLIFSMNEQFGNKSYTN
jgi:hypothetical protein